MANKSFPCPYCPRKFSRAQAVGSHIYYKHQPPKRRQYLPSFAELVDQLTVDQIKEVLVPELKQDVAQEMDKIANDINTIIDETGLALSARQIRIIIVLAQINLHIWHNKDKMQAEPEKYSDYLKLAHQLNGIRNQMKNLLLEETGDREKSARKTNFNTDGLEGWDISL